MYQSLEFVIEGVMQKLMFLKIAALSEYKADCVIKIFEKYQ